MKTFYFSPFDGDDSKNGMSKDSGFKTFQKTISAVRALNLEDCCVEVLGNGTLIIEPDQYFVGWSFVGIQNLIFNSSGNLILDGSGNCKNILYLRDCSRVSIKGFSVTGGFSKDSVGGGICITDSHYCLIDCKIYNNKAVIGGGIYIENGNGNNISGKIFENRADKGAGLYLKGNDNQINALFEKNTGSGSGRSFYISGENNSVNSSFVTEILVKEPENGAAKEANNKIEEKQNDIKENNNSLITNSTNSESHTLKNESKVPEKNNKTKNSGSIYVALKNGDDSNDGLSEKTPLKTLKGAFAAMKKYRFPHVEIRFYDSGIYRIPSDKNGACWSLSQVHDITLIAVDDIIIDGNGTCEHVLFMKNCVNVTVKNFILQHGFSINGVGGGIYMVDCTGCTIDSTVRNNTAPGGGGIYLEHSIENKIIGPVQNNKADLGGGIVLFGESNTVSGIVSDNSANLHAGGVMISESGNIVSGIVTRNSAQNGGGIVIESTGNEISGTVNNNEADFSGGVIIETGAENNIISGKIFNNKARSGLAGGISLKNRNNSITGEIRENNPNDFSRK